jgi:metal-responsive CopG/Arc/MetJ family transcriptional regulator
MPKDKYKGVSLPKDMVEEVERIVKEHPELGYTSVADFIKEAVREKILKLKQTLATTSP